jgi:heme-degrading monooxygenase HmoA
LGIKFFLKKVVNGGCVEIVLIDKFIVPEESKAKFLQEVRRSAAFVSKLPGFVEGYVHEKTGGQSQHNIVTVAVWKDEAAFQNARETASAEFERIGFRPQEIMKNLRVEMDRSTYRRLAY